MHRENLQTAKLLLEPTPRDATLELFISSPTLSEEYALGKLFLLIHIESIKDRAYELAITLRREVERRYYQGYNLKQDISVEKKFEETLARLNQTVSEMIAEQPGNFTLENIHFIIGVIHNRELHFTQFGATKAYLIHKIKGKDYRTINILDSLPEKTPTSMAKLFTNIISGEIDAHDALLLSTESLINYLSLDKLRLTIIHHSASEAAAHLGNLLKEINSRIAFGALILKYPSLPIIESQEEKRIEMKTSSEGNRSIIDLAHTEATTEEVLSPSLFTRLVRYAKNLLYWIKENLRTFSRKRTTKQFLHDSPKGNNIYERLARERTRFQRKDKFLKKCIRNAQNLSRAIVAIIAHIGKNIAKKFERKIIVGQDQEYSTIKNFYTKIREYPKKLKLATLGITLLAILLIINITARYQKNNEQIRSAQYRNTVSMLEEKLTEIEAALIYNDSVRAESALVESGSLLSALSPTNDEEKKEYLDLEKKFQLVANKSRHITLITDLPTITAIASKKEFLQKVGEKINQKGKILALRDGNNIFQYDATKKTIQEFSIALLPEQSLIISSEIYAGKLYMVTDNTEEIYRLQKSGNTFGSPFAWIKNGKEYLKNIQAITIDGGIYFLTKEKLLRFFNGSFEKEISLSITPKLENPNQMWTDSESNTLYFLDPPTKRVVATAKDGKLEKQWISEKWKDLQNFIVDEKGKKIYLLNGNEVYEITL